MLTGNYQGSTTLKGFKIPSRCCVVRGRILGESVHNDGTVFIHGIDMIHHPIYWHFSYSMHKGKYYKKTNGIPQQRTVIEKCTVVHCSLSLIININQKWLYLFQVHLPSFYKKDQHSITNNYFSLKWVHFHEWLQLFVAFHTLHLPITIH